MKKTILFFIALSFIFLSCEKESTEPKSNSDGKIISKRALLTKEIDAEGGITIVSTFLQNMPAQIETSGYFYEEGVLCSVDTATINCINMAFGETNTYFDYYVPDDENYPSHYIGNNLLVSAFGWSYGNINQEIYMPEVPILTFNQNCLSISKSEELTLTWEPDQGYNNQVLIGFVYRGPIEGGDYTYKTYYELVNDDGSYTVPSSFLNDIPNASKLEAYIGKANQIVIGMDEGIDIEFEIVTLIYNSFYCQVYE